MNRLLLIFTFVVKFTDDTAYLLSVRFTDKRQRTFSASAYFFVVFLRLSETYLICAAVKFRIIILSAVVLPEAYRTYLMSALRFFKGIVTAAGASALGGLIFTELVSSFVPLFESTLAEYLNYLVDIAVVVLVLPAVKLIEVLFCIAVAFFGGTVAFIEKIIGYFHEVGIVSRISSFAVSPKIWINTAEIRGELLRAFAVLFEFIIKKLIKSQKYLIFSHGKLLLTYWREILRICRIFL